MKLPPEHEDDDEGNDGPGPIGILLLVIVIVIAACSMSCVSTFHPDGKPKVLAGDYTYERTAAGDVKVTIKHSPVIRASGIATTQAIGAAGTAASAVILSTP